MGTEERTKRTVLLIIAAWALCSLVMLLPATQSLVLLMLEKLKGSSLRQPDLWKGRLRGAVGISLFACAFTAALTIAGHKKWNKVLYGTCIFCAIASFFLFPLKSRIAFQRFFCGLSLEDASDGFRTKLLLYKVLSFSSISFLVAFLVKNFSLSAALLKKTQNHTIIFSIILILSFISFTMGIPKHATGYLGNFWMFYANFDYGDYIETILKTDHNYSYPPLANILAGALKLPIATLQGSVASWEQGFKTLTPIGTYMLLLFFLTHLLPLLIVCHRAIEGNSFTKGLFSIAICMSSFFVYAIMRGNIILLAVACTLYYMIFYDSNDKRIRKTALLSLALAANIKVYPAIFGCLLLKEKRWKDIGLCAIYSVLLLIIPFFTYDKGFSFSFGRFLWHLGFAGSDKISAPAPQVVAPPSTVPEEASEPVEASSPTDKTEIAEANAEADRKPTVNAEDQKNEQKKKEGNRLIKALTAPTFGIFSLSNTVATVAKAMQAPRKVYSTLRVLSYLLYAALSMMLFIKAKKRWCVLLIPATACYLIPGMTYVYVPIFLLMPLIDLLNTKDKCPAEYGALLIFLCMFACNWTIWPCVIGYRQFPSILFSIGLYVAAFITEAKGTSAPIPPHLQSQESS